MRPTGRMLKVSGALLAVAAAGAGTAVASSSSGRVYGGITPQNWPIVLELDKSLSKVTRVVIGLDMTCTSNENFGTTDGFEDIKINSKNRLKSKFGPQRIDAAGTPADIEGAITGRRSKDRRSFKGTWNYKIVFYDAAGTTVLDTCESGLVRWKVVQ
ncbi:MAG TPA: hypothetical protein VMY78_03325 [Solirubrobacteraceae bacterium]|nr:hypothetical protein [Solirubrobacteraceae bacterium]